MAGLGFEQKMIRKEKTPWLDYTGQDTAQILACKGTHRIDSLLCVFEEAIQLRQKQKPAVATTPEENTLLAIMALQREVNNGGYGQFFTNSSRKYASTVVPALESIGCAATAALTQSALNALNLNGRDQALDALDQQFYKIVEIESRLWAFVEAHQQAFVLERVYMAPRPPDRVNHNLIRLGVGFEFAPTPDLTFEAVRKLAAEIASKEGIEPTASELDGAAYQFLLKSFLRAGDLERCETVAGPAFDLAREDTSHCILQKDWVEKMIEASNFTRADEVTLQYLEYLAADDTSIDFIRNRVKFWARPLGKHGANLPRSLEFFRTNFPDFSLSEPPLTIFRSPR